MNKKLIDEINDKTDIVALISSYVKLDRRGKNYFGLCPFHDDNDPSMSVSPEKNIFKCFSCGVGGSPLQFYQQINHTTFNEAIAALAEPLGIKVNFTKKQVAELIEYDVLEETNKFYQYNLKNSKSGEEALEYLKKRGLKEETINHFEIGLSPEKDALYKLLKQKNFTEEQMLSSQIVVLKNNEYKDFFNSRIMFPIRDINGNVVGFSGRGVDNRTPKYYNSPDSKIFKKGETLYHLYAALKEIRKLGYAIIHEGFFDCIASFDAGLKNTIATMGTALTHTHAKLIENYTKRIVIAFDGDNAGVNAAIKAIEVFKGTSLRVDVLKLPKDLDPDDYIKKYGKDKYLKLYETALQDQYEFIYSATKENLDLKNINDMTILKEATKNMLIRATQSVKELYLRRLSEDLNVSVSSLSKEISGKTSTTIVKKEQKQSFKKELPFKYYNAEKQLIISMLRDKEQASRIDQALGANYVCDIKMFKLRSFLQYKYYSYYDVFNEENFRNIAEEEPNNQDLLVALNEILNSLEYDERFIYTDEEIDQNIKILENVVNEKEYRELKVSISKETESYQKTILLEEQKRLKQEQHKLNSKSTK